MKKKINSIFEEVLTKIIPDKKNLKFINEEVGNFIKKSKKEAKKLKINVEIFVGGSIAKGTLIKKDFYDADIFFRFSKKYSGKSLTKMTQTILKNFKNKSLIHGSRDYFRIKISKNFYIEIVPVLKIKKPDEGENITDLSYSHVNYVKKKIKNKNLLKEIMLAKAFCQANGFYGAESYIKGFSGYALELLIIYYKTFEKMLNKLCISKEKKIIIDIEKYYKNKREILLDLNESKLDSPIILIDPTHKYRNAAAALSDETFKKFVKEAKKFLKSPSTKSFEPKKTDIELVKKNAKKNKNDFVFIEIKTLKQEGDVAGTKLFKFYNHLLEETKPFFDIKNKGFNYNHKKSARFFIVGKKKKEFIREGPLTKDKKNVIKFKKEHKNTFKKKNRIYSREKINTNLKQFLQGWRNKNKKKIKEMYITEMKIID